MDARSGSVLNPAQVTKRRATDAHQETRRIVAGRRVPAEPEATQAVVPERRRSNRAGEEPHHNPSAAAGNEESFAAIARRLGANRSALGHAIEATTGKRTASEVTGADLAAVAAALANHSLAYRHVMQGQLRKIGRDAGIEEERIARVPKLPGCTPREVCVPEAEFEAGLRCAPPYLELILLLAHEAGLRHQAARTITRANVDFDRNRIVGKTKGGTLYDVPMTERLKARLLWFCAAAQDAHEPLAAVFRSPRLAPTDNAVRAAMAQMRHAARLTSKWNVHDIRRTAARALYERTRDIRKVQAFLGHRMLWTTCWYLGNGQIQLEAKDLEQIPPPKETKSA